MSKINQYLYYIIIGVLSVLTIIIFPMIGSEFGIEFSLPDTPIAWLIYIGSALATATINIMIFYAFMCQAKINVKDNEKFKEANDILLQLSIRKDKKIKRPKSPKEWNVIQYGKKGTTIFLSSIFSCFVFTNAIIQYDLIVLLTYSFTVVFAIIFGVFQMKVAEKYWTEEYYLYAIYEKNLIEAEEKSDDNDR